MKIISWNVNGLRACIAKGFYEFMDTENPDIICLQETKMQEGQADLEKEGYLRFMSSAEKKGYAGTLIYSKVKPINVVYGIDGKYNDEGRVITLEFDNFFMVGAYVPNAQEGLKRIDYRMIFEDDMRNYLVSLSKVKPVVYTGDLNVAHEPIDLKNPKANEGAAGYSSYEREKMTALLDAGFVDTFRALHPEKQEFSWWSYRFSARQKNIGWRIDYFLVSKDIEKKVVDSKILTQVLGSDHAPGGLEIDL